MRREKETVAKQLTIVGHIAGHLRQGTGDRRQGEKETVAKQLTLVGHSAGHLRQGTGDRESRRLWPNN